MHPIPLPIYNMRIPHIRLHKVYHETLDLLSSTNSRIYDKDKCKQVKVIILYKYAMNSNTFLFDPTEPEIGHSRVGQDQVVSTYVHSVAQ